MLKNLLRSVDNLLNGITMYRLALYYLLALWVIAIVFGFFHLLPYDPTGIAFSAIFITAVSLIANILLARVFGAPTNVESVYITALILTLIISPPVAGRYAAYFSLAVWASVWAMASKFILAIRKKHIFNPAAFAVALTGLTLALPATWWIGTPVMAPFVLVGGLLLTRKLIRFDLVVSFFASTLLSIALTGASPSLASIGNLFVLTPIFFFAFVMLTEPLTSPPTRPLRIAYGVLVGFLFAPNIHIGGIYSTPELALVAGNVFSYIVSPKKKLLLRLEGKKQLTPDTYEFSFTPDEALAFRPGQYMEWTLGHRRPDTRGNRRYFTVASSPTEPRLRLGVKFYPEASSFKRALASIDGSKIIVASQLAGDFTLPKDKQKKLAFLAGGIGITPFRSMVRYFMDTGETRDVVLFYSNRTIDDVAYKDLFDEAEGRGIVRPVYTLTDAVPEAWSGERGFINAQMIARHTPDYRERIFYLSGPRSAVIAFEQALLALGVRRSRIKKDFFPGFA